MGPAFSAANGEQAPSTRAAWRISSAAMRHSRMSPWAAALALFVPTLAAAETLPTLREVTSVRAAGMGNAVRGFASGTEAILVNPAGIAATIRFNVEASAFLQPAQDHRVFTAASVDSKLNADEAFALSGGVGYHYYVSGEGDARRSGSIVGVGLAVPLYPELLFLGVTGKYLKLSGAVESNAVTLDTGLILRPLPSLGLGAVGYNLVDIHNPEARRSWGFGVALGQDTSFHVDFDVRLDPDENDEQVLSYFAGAEYVIADMVVPRLGFAEDKLRDAREISGGVTVIVSGLAIEGAYRHALGGVGRGFGISLRLLDSPM